jgi:hypothetical protein
MQSTAYERDQETIRGFASIALPRLVRRSWSYWIVSLIIFLILFFISDSVFKIVSRSPVNYPELGFEVLAGSFAIWTVVIVLISPRSRALLKWGTPVLGRVLFEKAARNSLRVRYSYEVAPGIVLYGQMNAFRARDLAEGMAVIIFYDPKRPEKSVLMDYARWSIVLPGDFDSLA